MNKNFKHTGDCGYTCLLNGCKVKKNHKIVRALGEIDTTVSYIGYLKVNIKSKTIKGKLTQIQKHLFLISSSVYSSRPDKKIKEALKFLDDETEQLQKKTKPINKFIIPGRNKPESIAHITRTKVRAAESSVVDISKNGDSIKYLNRLSKYLFLLALSFK